MNPSLQDFKSALRKGLGRATVLLRTAPESQEFAEALLESCITNQIYDRQCEVERVSYLYRLILETGQIEFYRSTLLRHLHSYKTEPGKIDVCQTYGILCRIAAGGHDDDRVALREFILGLDYDIAARHCAYLFVWLEGIEGFILCVQKFYRSLVENFDDGGWQFHSLLHELEERDGAEITKVSLQKLRSEIPELDALLRLNEAQDVSSPPEPDAPFDYNLLKANLDTKLGFPRAWIKTAPIEELTLAAGDLLTETDEKKIWRYLQIFFKREFPLNTVEVFRFLESTNRRISRAALKILQGTKHPSIRALALQTISKGEDLELGIRLLAGNFQPGDLTEIEKIISRLQPDEDTWHGLGFAISDVLEYSSVPPDESRGLLLRLYEETPCTFCRSGFVEELQKTGQVPEWMANEARFDVDPGTSDLFKESLERKQVADA